MTHYDTVIDAVITALQGDSDLSYVPNEHIVKRVSPEEDPGEWRFYAIAVSLNGVPLPHNRLGGRIKTVFPLAIKLFVKIPGATREQLVAGDGTQAGIAEFIRDVQDALIQNTLGGVVSSPGLPLPGGAVQFEGTGEQATPTAKVTLSYEAIVKEQKG
ncbi:MAG: hypothetical protein KOO60_11010 [Gemmatimonadales bacterium]|nr:hypothetical protein [Gemmatimonadales bacterium]